MLGGNGGPPEASDLAANAVAALERATRSTLAAVINATGVVIHTNLGRAPLAFEALEAIDSVASGYSNLEYVLAHGVRGSRQAHVETLLCELTGAEAALAVNNNAAGVLLVLVLALVPAAPTGPAPSRAGDRARLLVGALTVFLAAPWIAAELGFFLDGVPVLGSIFITGKIARIPGGFAQQVVLEVHRVDCLDHDAAIDLLIGGQVTQRHAFEPSAVVAQRGQAGESAGLGHVRPLVVVRVEAYLGREHRLGREEVVQE